MHIVTKHPIDLGLVIQVLTLSFQHSTVYTFSHWWRRMSKRPWGPRCQGVVCDQWMLHLQVMEQIWARYSCSGIVLFAQCGLLHSECSPGWRHTSHTSYSTPTLTSVRQDNHRLILIAPHWPALRCWQRHILDTASLGSWWNFLSQGGGMPFHLHPVIYELPVQASAGLQTLTSVGFTGSSGGK